MFEGWFGSGACDGPEIVDNRDQKISDLNETVYNLRNRVHAAERETAQVREALPYLRDVDVLLYAIAGRMVKMDGVTAWISPAELELLRKAYPHKAD